MRRFWLFAGVLLASVVGVGAGGLYLHHQAASGHPELGALPELELPPSERAGLPDVWPELVAAADSQLPDEVNPRDLLVVGEPPAAADLDGLNPQTDAIAALRAVDALRANVRVPTRQGLAEEGPDLVPLVRLSQVWLVNAWRTAVQGDPTQAVAEVVSVWQLSRLLVEGESDLVTTVVGLRMEGHALTQMRALLEGPARADAEAFALAARALAEGRDNAMVRALSSEWRMYEGHLAAMPQPGCGDLSPDRGGDSWRIICRAIPAMPRVSWHS